MAETKVRKRPVKKTGSAPAVKTPGKVAASKTPAKKTAAKKAPAKAPAKKTTPAPKKTAAKKADPRVPHPREMTPEGFVVGSDSAIVAAGLLEGGFDRNDVNVRIEDSIKKANGLDTRGGGSKYIPSMASAILNKMLATGKYEIESTWRLVPKAAPVKKARGKK